MQNKNKKQKKKQQKQQQQKIKQKNPKKTNKKNKKQEVCFEGYCWQFVLPFLIKHFPPRNFLLHTSSYKPFMQRSEKSTNYFGSIQQAIERKSCNIYQEKLIMSGTDRILIVNINTQN